MTNQLRFPPGFLWGTANSSHQVEGDNRRNQWWLFEHRPGAIWREERSGLACDWWRNAEQDFDRMAQLHLNTHRLSIEWSRVEPEPGVIDHNALDRYRAMLGGLLERGIQPLVALHHFTNPRWFERAKGWLWAESVTRFESYVRIVVGALGDLCTFWLTFNEPIVYLGQGWVSGQWPPRRRNFLQAQRVFLHLLHGHAAAYHAIHGLQPKARVSYAHAFHAFRGYRPQHPLDKLVAWLKAYLVDQLWLEATVDGVLRPPLGMGRVCPRLAGTLDFVGVNYYTSTRVRFTPNPLALFGHERLAANSELSDCGRSGRPYSAYQPRGLYSHCIELGSLGKPIYITENGLPDADDDQRPRWLLGHLYQIHRALVAGSDIRGYFHWTLTDNFEWTDGWGLRFGLFALDPQTQTRTARASAHLYGAIAQANAVTQQMVEQYAPEVLPEYFGE